MSSHGLLQRTRCTLDKIGIKPSRKLGQNYVVDPSLIACMLGAAGIDRGETVLEIGAGIGTLTRELASRAGRVIAVEKDAAAAEFLREEFGSYSSRGSRGGGISGSNVEVITGDILLMELPEADKVVANLPYSISTPITFKLLTEGSFDKAVLTYQKEVAKRMAAAPGGREYSRLSVASSLLAEVRVEGIFPPESFYPLPGVESAVVVMSRRADSGVDWPWLDDTLKALFSQRKRKLRKALRTYSKIKRLEAIAVLSGIGMELLEKRVFELTPAEFVWLCEKLREIPGNAIPKACGGASK